MKSSTYLTLLSIVSFAGLCLLGLTLSQRIENHVKKEVQARIGEVPNIEWLVDGRDIDLFAGTITQFKELKTRLLEINGVGDIVWRQIPNEEQKTIFTEMKNIPMEPTRESSPITKESHLSIPNDIETLKVFFYYDSAIIKSQSFSHLIQASHWMKSQPHLTVSILGYASDRKSDAYNKKLSLDRAVQIRDHLISLGVSAHRLVTSGEGEPQENELKTTFSTIKKRRVEFRVIPEAS